MLFPHILAQATTAASAPAASESAEPDFATILVNVAFLLWAILALLALLKFRVLTPASLRNAPRRTASLLLPTFFGSILLYWALLIVAVGIGQRSHLIPQLHASATAPPASQSQPSTATAATPGASPTDLSPEQNMWLGICDTAAKIAVTAIMLALVPLLFQEGLRGIGLAPRQLLRGILLGILAFLIIIPLLEVSDQILMMIFAALHHHPKDQDVVDMLQQARHSVKIVDSLLAAPLAPILEEIFFRGFLQTALIQKPSRLFDLWLPRHAPVASAQFTPSPLRRWSAIVITALIFGAAHGAPDQFPILFLLAVGLGYLYERTGNLFASITVHCLFNLMTVIPLFVYTS